MNLDLTGLFCNIGKVIGDIAHQITLHKDFLGAIQALVTTVTIPIAAFWTWKRFSAERPFEPSLNLEISASAIAIDESSNMLHVEISLKNAGRAAFDLFEPTKEPNRSWIRIYVVNKDIDTNAARKGWFDWNNKTLATMVFDGWFTDTPHLMLEAGEEETYAADLVLPEDAKAVNVWVKIYESKIKNAKMANPYFWSTQRVFTIAKLVASQKSQD